MGMAECEPNVPMPSTRQGALTTELTTQVRASQWAALCGPKVLAGHRRLMSALEPFAGVNRLYASSEKCHSLRDAVLILYRGYCFHNWGR
jgi:hypothetical protein